MIYQVFIFLSLADRGKWSWKETRGGGILGKPVPSQSKHGVWDMIRDKTGFRSTDWVRDGT